jgi:hypothetical protein
VGPRAGLADVDRRKILSLWGLELRPLGLPVPEGPYVISINFIKVKVKLSLEQTVEAHKVVRRRGSHIF